MTFRSLYLLLISAIACSACSINAKQKIANETCDCLAQQPIDKDLIATIMICEQDAIERNKAALAQQFKIDTTSSNDMLDLTVEISVMLFSNCEVLKKNKALMDSLRKAGSESQESVKTGMYNAMKGGIRVEGVFIEEEKISDRHRHLYLKINDSIVVFQSMPFFGEAERSALRKKGNNVTITYINYYNPVTKKVDKIVKALMPIYGDLGQ